MAEKSRSLSEKEKITLELKAFVDNYKAGYMDAYKRFKGQGRRNIGNPSIQRFFKNMMWADFVKRYGHILHIGKKEEEEQNDTGKNRSNKSKEQLTSA